MYIDKTCVQVHVIPLSISQLFTCFLSLGSSCDNSSVPSSACNAVIEPLIDSKSLS